VGPFAPLPLPLAEPLRPNMPDLPDEVAEAEAEADVEVEGAVDAEAVEPEEVWEDCDDERTLRHSDFTPDVTSSPRSTGSSLRMVVSTGFSLTSDSQLHKSSFTLADHLSHLCPLQRHPE
jgi:hypothetical protein